MPAPLHQRDHLLVGAAVADGPVPLPTPGAAEVAAGLCWPAVASAHADQHSLHG